MGRKSSAKAQTRSTPIDGGTPPETPRRSTKSVVGIAAVVIAAALGIFVATPPSAAPPAAAPTPAAQNTPQPPGDETPRDAKLVPHRQGDPRPVPSDRRPHS